MGGRGAASGVSAKGIRYGNEYVSVIRVDNIKFVKRRDGSPATLPLETMSQGRNRVYVSINRKDEVKSIGFYDKEGKLARQIDLDHFHQGQKPHVHIGYGHSKEFIPLTQRDQEYIDKVNRVWEEVNK